MADSDDPTEAALRLEAALERIARLARPAPPANPDGPASSDPSAFDPAPIAERLDALILQLRAALGEG